MKHYLDATTEPKITRVVENELLREQVRGRVEGEELLRERVQEWCPLSAGHYLGPQRAHT